MNTETISQPRQTMNGKPVFTIPANTIINFKSHFDRKLLCDGITFTAGSACAYSCSFCYVEDMMRKAQAYQAKHGVTGGHFSHVVRRANAVETAHQQIMSKPEAFRMAKKTIYASPTVDVAANMELVRETVQICQQILELTTWEIRLLSKSNLLPKVAEGLGEYRNAKNRIIYGVSTGTLDDKLAAAFEEGTPKVSKRIESLHWLQDHGYRTFGMICPSLPQAHHHPDNYRKFAQEMMQAIRAERCEHVWAEVINVRGESFTRTHAALEAADFHDEAMRIKSVSENREIWENYAIKTFQAEAEVLAGQLGPDGTPKLRFLQYVTKASRPWWESQVNKGAVLL